MRRTHNLEKRGRAWRARWSDGADANGKRIQHRRTFATKREAEAFLATVTTTNNQQRKILAGQFLASTLEPDLLSRPPIQPVLGQRTKRGFRVRDVGAN